MKEGTGFRPHGYDLMTSTHLELWMKTYLFLFLRNDEINASYSDGFIIVEAINLTAQDGTLSMKPGEVRPSCKVKPDECLNICI